MRRIPLLITIFTVAVLVVAAVIIGLLYRTSLAQETTRLEEVVHSQARLIEAIARHEAKYSHLMPAESGHGDALAATLAQVRDANERFSGFGLTGEFTLARREGDSIVYLLTQRHPGSMRTMAISFNGTAGEPMRRALSGLSGTVIGPDYRGVKVLAAHEPVSEFGLGIVAKIDMAEIQAPFVHAGLISIVAALVVVLLGSLLFYRITNPVLVQLRESEARLRTILTTAHDAVVMMDSEGAVAYWNPAAERVFGWRADEVIGRDLHEFMAPVRFRDAFVKAFPAFLRTGEGASVGKTLELVAIHKDGQELPVELSLSAIRVNDQWHAVGIMRDIAERMAAQQALAAKSQELVRSNEELEQFAYVASHDLQQPLRMVASYVELLGQRYKGRLDEKADRYIAYASGGAIRMHELVNALLAFSRVGTRAAQPAPVSLNRVVAQAKENVAVAIEKSGAVIEAGPLPVVSGDETQLVSLFQNLLDNAIKFRGSEPPKIRITSEGVPSLAPLNPGPLESSSVPESVESAKSADARSAFWVISVADNGIGIEARHQERVFKLFQRLHTEGEYPGTGLGLAICRKIVDRHGGTIRVASEPGKGSTFTFTLPGAIMEISPEKP